MRIRIILLATALAGSVAFAPAGFSSAEQAQGEGTGSDGFTLVENEAGPAGAYPRPGEIERVSTGPSGSEGNKNAGGSPTVTPDGRYVAFTSFASNLVADDTNGQRDAFVHDRLTGVTERVSVASDGTQADSTTIDPIDISADGRFVVFPSYAANLVAGDTNGTVDVFVHDRDTGVTERVSVASDGTEANDASAIPSISADGRYVTFTSFAANLVPGDTNDTRDVFVHDRDSGTTERVSVSGQGEQANGDSVVARISGDGRFVAFDSLASNLVAGDTNAARDIFVHDRDTGVTERVSVATDGTQGDRDAVWNPAISGDGRYVSFASTASNLVPSDANNSCGQVTLIGPDGSRTGVENCSDTFVHDRQTGVTERVSVASDGQEGDNDSGPGSISDDGRFVAFHSSASNLVPGDSNNFCGLGNENCPDVFVHDRLTGGTQRLSVGLHGLMVEGDKGSRSPALSSDGRWVTFDSHASNLVPGDDNGKTDIFVRQYGPGTGAGALQVRPGSDGLEVTGWVTMAGAPVSVAADPSGDGGVGVGADIVGGAVVYRPELDDLLLRLQLTVPDVTEAPAGVVYRWALEVGPTPYEVRVTRPGLEADPPSTDWGFALYRCDGDCVKIGNLTGAVGTVGPEVLVSLPLADVDAAEGTAITNLAAFVELGAPVLGSLSQLDSVELADTVLPAVTVAIGTAATSTPAEDVLFTESAEVSDGWIAHTLPSEGLTPGAHRVWLRACLGEACDAASAVIPTH